MKVQITVDKMLWRKARVAALNFGETMGQFVERSINESLGGGSRQEPKVRSVREGLGLELVKNKTPSVPVTAPQNAPIIYPDEVVSARHKCAICHLSFPETEMTYHAKTLRWACNECLEKQT